MIWNIVVRAVTRYAPFVTVPFAGVIGYIGYNLEELLSDKYTPFSESIQEKRIARLSTDEKLDDALNSAQNSPPTNSVLDRNLSPSLHAKKNEEKLKE